MKEYSSGQVVVWREGYSHEDCESWMPGKVISENYWDVKIKCSDGPIRNIPKTWIKVPQDNK